MHNTTITLKRAGREWLTLERDGHEVATIQRTTDGRGRNPALALYTPHPDGGEVVTEHATLRHAVTSFSGGNHPAPTCPVCDGEGTLLVSTPGGVFDSREGQWFPDEEEEECPTCDGTGELHETAAWS